MKKELDFITIDGKYYGGDQNWHPTNRLMRIGGCSAVCACEVCAYLEKACEGRRGLYPYDPENITKTDFLRFFETMFGYVRPGIGGLTSIDKFVRMFTSYVKNETAAELSVERLYGASSFGAARDFIKTAIDAGSPVMYLMLSHRDPAFDPYEWHWFTVTGYEQEGDAFTIRFATWGRPHSFDLKTAWDTGKWRRGGLVRAGWQDKKLPRKLEQAES